MTVKYLKSHYQIIRVVDGMYVFDIVNAWKKANVDEGEYYTSD